MTLTHINIEQRLYSCFILIGGRGRGRGKDNKRKNLTAEQLDAEMDSWRMKDEKVRFVATSQI